MIGAEARQRSISVLDTVPPRINLPLRPLGKVKFLRRHWRAIHFFLTLFMDQASLVVAYWSAYMVRFDIVPHFFSLPSFYKALLPGSSLMLFLTIVAVGGYRKVESVSFQKQVEIVSRAVLIHTVGILALLFLTQGYQYSRLFLGFFFMFLTSYLFIMRIWLDGLNSFMGRLGYGVRRAAILGVSHSGGKLFRRLSSAPRLGYDLCGFIDMAERYKEPDSGDYYNGGMILGREEELGEVIDRWNIEQIFTLEWSIESNRYDHIVKLCEEKNVGFKYISPATESLFKTCGLDDLTGIPLVVRTRTPLRRLNDVLISVFDRITAAILLVVMSPIFLVLAIAVKLDSPGPFFFRQKRLTVGMREFTLFKIRTMEVNAEEEKENLDKLNEATGPIFKIKNDPRVSRVGRILRKYSLDELPQLINVFFGEMSLVGPRPPLRSEVEKYKTWQLQRLKTKQGMTGLWQVSGRSELTFEEMVLLDLYYIENRHFLFNLELLISTLPSVMAGKGAY